MPVNYLDIKTQNSFLKCIKKKKFTISNLDGDDYRHLLCCFREKTGNEDYLSCSAMYEYHRQKSIINAINEYILIHGIRNTALKLGNLDMDHGTLQIGNSYYHFFNEGFYVCKSENGIVVDACIETYSLGVWLMLTETIPIELFDEFCLIANKRGVNIVEDDEIYNNCGFNTTRHRLSKSKSSFAKKIMENLS